MEFNDDDGWMNLNDYTFKWFNEDTFTDAYAKENEPLPRPDFPILPPPPPKKEKKKPRVAVLKYSTFYYPFQNLYTTEVVVKELNKELGN